MTRIYRLGVTCSFILAGLFLLQGMASADRSAPVTFTKDVAPIIFNNCAACHRAGEVAPMTLLSYKEVRPWAKSIKEVVRERRMPPWGADPQHGEFSNDRALSQKDIDTIAAWVDGGAREGDPKDLPPLPRLVEGWNIGKPDVVFSMPEEFNVPADGIVPYQNYTIRTNFTEDKYIQAAEVRVGNRSVVHHAVVFIEEPGFSRPAQVDPAHSQENRLAGYAPGQVPLVLRPGVVRVVKKGSVLVFNMHYTPNGAPAKDRTTIGLIFAKRPVEKHLGSLIVGTRKIEIPPGDPNHEIKASYVVKEDIHIESLGPHAHARAKDFLYTLVYPDGTSKVLLWVPRYDFNWQITYTLSKPLAVPKGSRIECVAHYDNSVKNKYNPDPTQLVRFGWQTWDEMLAGYVNYTIDSESLLQETGKLRERISN
jgi:hypothetical protein